MPFFVTAAMKRLKMLAGIDPPWTPPDTPRRFIIGVAARGYPIHTAAVILGV